MTNEAQRNEDTVEPLVRQAVETLKSNGPMKCCDLAHMLGLQNGRRLSMLLQWREGKAHDVTMERGKWVHKPNKGMTVSGYPPERNDNRKDTEEDERCQT